MHFAQAQSDMSRRSVATEKDSSGLVQVKASQSVMIAQKSSSISSLTRENRLGEGDNVYGSVERQNFVVLSILLASLCGCFNILTLTCSLPAIFASIRVSRAEEQSVKVVKTTAECALYVLLLGAV